LPLCLPLVYPAYNAYPASIAGSTYLIYPAFFLLGRLFRLPYFPGFFRLSPPKKLRKQLRKQQLHGSFTIFSRRQLLF